MDLLESGRERGTSAPVLPRDPRLVGLVAVLVLVGGLLALGPVEREATRVDLAVTLEASSAEADGEAVRGELVLQLANARDRPSRLRDVAVDVEGLRVEGVEPAAGEVPAGGTLLVRVGYLVPSCRQLVLPGVVDVQVDAGGDPAVISNPVVLDGAGFRLLACESPLSAAVAVRPAGGEVARGPTGASGQVRVEVRASQPLRLLGLDVALDGVRSIRRVLAGGRTIVADEVVVVRLRFSVPDCAALAAAGELVLVLERGGGQEELRLPVARDGPGPAVELPTVLDACDG